MVNVRDETHVARQPSKKWPNYMQQYRSNLQTIIMTVKSLNLSDKHLEKIRLTPFWMIVSSIIDGRLEQKQCKKSDVDIEKIVKLYNSKSKGFIISKVEANVKCNDIRLIFGINDGKEPIACGKRPRNINSNFAERRFNNVKRLTKLKLKDALKDAVAGQSEDDIEDVARLIHLIFLVSLFVPDRGQNLGWSYLKYVDDIECITAYNWSAHILEVLTNSLHAKSLKPRNVAGCVMVLPYWLCEHCNIIKPKMRDACPRLLKWDLQNFTEVLNLKSLKIVNMKPLKMTPLEEEYLNKDFIGAPDNDKQNDKANNIEDSGEDDKVGSDDYNDDEGNYDETLFDFTKRLKLLSKIREDEERQVDEASVGINLEDDEELIGKSYNETEASTPIDEHTQHENEATDTLSRDEHAQVEQPVNLDVIFKAIDEMEARTKKRNEEMANVQMTLTSKLKSQLLASHERLILIVSVLKHCLTSMEKIEKDYQNVVNDFIPNMFAIQQRIEELESENSILREKNNSPLDQVSEGALRKITQENYSTSMVQQPVSVPQTLMVCNLKGKKRKTNEDAEYRYPGRRGKKKKEDNNPSSVKKNTIAAKQLVKFPTTRYLAAAYKQKVLQIEKSIGSVMGGQE